MPDRTSCRSPLAIGAFLSLSLLLAQAQPTRGQIAAKESSSRIIHRFPPLPDIVQRKAEIDAKRSRIGVLNKLLNPVRPNTQPVLEIDLSKGPGPAPAQPTSITQNRPPQDKNQPSNPEPTVSTAPNEPAPSEEIVRTGHEEKVSPETSPGEIAPILPDAEPERFPTLPPAEQAAEPVLPATNVPTLRAQAPLSGSNAAEPVAAPAMPEVVGPVKSSMKSTSMRRDRRRQDTNAPGRPPAPREPSEELGSLPRTLPEMDAPPIREALTPEQIAKAQKDLEEKLQAVVHGPEVVLPPMPATAENGETSSAAAEPEKVPSEPIDLAPASAQPHDEMAQARTELHRLAKPIPVEDPSLELAAEELKQLAGTQDLPAPATAPTPAGSNSRGLQFARDAVLTSPPPPPARRPEPTPATKKEAPAAQPTPLPAPQPASISLPPVVLDDPAPTEALPQTTEEKKEPAELPAGPLPKPTPTTKQTSQETSPAKSVSPSAEPLLRAIPPAASLEKTTLPSSAGPKQEAALPTKVANNIPRLRREPASAETPPKGPAAKEIPAPTPKPIVQRANARGNAGPPEVTSLPIPADLPIPVSKPAKSAEPNLPGELARGTTSPSSKPLPKSWRPAMPPVRNEWKVEQSPAEILPTSGSAASTTEGLVLPANHETSTGAPSPPPVDPSKPRMLAPIEADDSGTTSTRSILSPDGEKTQRLEFSRSLAARAIDTLHQSRARTARERALAELARMEQWHKAPGAIEALKQVATADERLLMRQAAVEVLASVPRGERQIDSVLSDIAASNSESAVRQLARETLSQRTR